MTDRGFNLLVACLCFGACLSFGQVTVSLGGGIATTNVNEFGSSYEFQLGGFYRVFDRVDLGLSVGYQKFSGMPANYTSKFIPVALEGRFHFSNEGVDPYFLAKIGLAHLEYHYDEVFQMPADFGRYTTSSMKQFYHDNNPIYALGAGVIVPLTREFKADVGFQLTVVQSRLNRQLVSYAGINPVATSDPSAWLLSQWSVGIRWDL